MKKLIKKLALITIGVVIGRVVYKKDQVRFYSKVTPKAVISLATNEEVATMIIQKAKAIEFHRAYRT